MSTGSVLFAGGGTGGHLYPEIAVAERLVSQVDIQCHFMCSTRPLDTAILKKTEFPYTTLPVRPLPRKPWHWIPFVVDYRRSVSKAFKFIQDHQVKCVIATGGFVSGPVISAAQNAGIHSVLINLDAVPGKANRWLAPKVNRLLTVYETPVFPMAAAKIELPIRSSAIFTGSREEALARLGLSTDPDLRTLVITGASQGARSLNQMMGKMCASQDFRKAMNNWQLLHLCGQGQEGELATNYKESGISAIVIDFCDQMSDVWGVADLVISRGGAGSVAEIVANRCPALIFPYPYHKDQHQRKNAEPYAKQGAMVIIDDLIDAQSNADQLVPILCELLQNEEKWAKMKHIMKQWPVQQGAEQVVGITRLLLGM